MTQNQTEGQLSGIVAALREVIAAVDCRVPHRERASELYIAKIAAALRIEAVNRLEEIIRIDADRDERDRDTVGAIMSDDGGPVQADLLARAAG
jgi:hypothetical protein